MGVFDGCEPCATPYFNTTDVSQYISFSRSVNCFSESEAVNDASGIEFLPNTLFHKLDVSYLRGNFRHY